MRAGRRGRLSVFFATRPRLRLVLLLVPPMLAFVVVYIGSLTAMLVSAFWTVDSFTENVAQAGSSCQGTPGTTCAYRYRADSSAWYPPRAR